MYMQHARWSMDLHVHRLSLSTTQHALAAVTVVHIVVCKFTTTMTHKHRTSASSNGLNGSGNSSNYIRLDFLISDHKAAHWLGAVEACCHVSDGGM